LLPVTEDNERDPGTGLQSMVYALLLAGMVWIPFVTGAFSLLAAILTSVLGLIYAWFGFKLWQDSDRPSALRLMFFSLAYLPLVFTIGWLI
jgi:heme O synthase-like polyprenyltransferase